MKPAVLIAMSGGVDSSLACLLLKRNGYRCIGATIKLWPKEECGDSEKRKRCCSLEAISSARGVAQKLDIPYFVFDFSREFKSIIKNYFTREYKRGRTPNPCILCNSEIKFGLFLKKAKELDCRFVVSGHYARVEYSPKTKKVFLKKGKDRLRDQSYFLFNLTQEQLRHILFPLGGMTKEKVREMAEAFGLKSYNRVSSQDICFEPQKMRDKSGDIIFNDGRVLGKHRGIQYYTIGQRKGLGIAYREPLYVTGIDAATNTIYVGTKSDTYKKTLTANNLNWVGKPPLRRHLRINAKIRYGAKEAPARVRPLSGNEVEVEFDKPQSSPTPGQAVVFYKGDRVLGGGWIKEIKNEK